MSVVIEFRGLKKSYLKNIVLDSIDLELHSARFYALLGRNGAGKSTLMRVLMRYEAPDQGEGQILGHSMLEDISEINYHVGYVSESIDYAVPGPLSSFFPIFPKLYPKWDAGLFNRMLSNLGISGDEQFAALSRGQRMQVAFAVAVAIRPKILLLDEITSVLDARARSIVMNHLASFAREGGTVVMATNIVSETHHYADHLILLDSGKVKFNLRVEEVASMFVRLRKPAKTEDPLFDLPDCLSVGINPDDSLAYVMPIEVAAKISIPEAFKDSQRVNPEEAFIYFTKKRAA